MAGRGNLEYVFLKNKDGSLRDDNQIKKGTIAKIYVRPIEEGKEPEKIYTLDYSFSNGGSVFIVFCDNKLVISHYKDNDKVISICDENGCFEEESEDEKIDLEKMRKSDEYMLLEKKSSEELISLSEGMLNKVKKKNQKVKILIEEANQILKSSELIIIHEILKERIEDECE